MWNQFWGISWTEKLINSWPPFWMCFIYRPQPLALILPEFIKGFEPKNFRRPNFLTWPWSLRDSSSYSLSRLKAKEPKIESLKASLHKISGVTNSFQNEIRLCSHDELTWSTPQVYLRQKCDLKSLRFPSRTWPWISRLPYNRVSREVTSLDFTWNQIW